MTSRKQPTTAYSTGPLRPSAGAHCALRPIGQARLDGGFRGERRRVNAEVCIPQGPALLDAAGNLHDLRLAAGQAEGAYRGGYPFLDTDVRGADHADHRVTCGGEAALVEPGTAAIGSLPGLRLQPLVEHTEQTAQRTLSARPAAPTRPPRSSS